MSKVGLVTVLFNSDNLLEGFIKSLSTQTYTNFHMYFVDNTPSIKTDRLLFEILARYNIKNFSHIKYESNVGIATANNRGIKEALKIGCEFVLLLNNDIEFDQANLIETMVSTANERNEAFVVPKIYFYDTKKVWMAGGYFKWWKAMAYHVGEWESDSIEYSNEGYFNFAPGCFILVRSTIFKQIGLIDERYFVYFEDTDFIYRASQIGHKILFLPQLKILHKVGSSTGGYDALFGIYYGNRNRIYFIKKHYGIWKKIVSYSYVLVTRMFKYIKYDKRQRKELLRALKDGFTMKCD